MSVRALPLGIVVVLLGACNFAPRYQRPTVDAPSAFKEAQPGPADPAAGFRLAAPRDAELRGNWWEVYDDPQLDQLEAQVAISNQTIAAAEANYRAANALVREAQAELFPTFTLNPAVVRQKSSGSAAAAGAGISTGGTGGTGTGVGVGTGTGTGVGGLPGTGGTTGVTTGGTTTTGGATGGGTVTSISTGPHTIFELPLEAAYQVDLWGSVRNTVAENRFAAEASAATLANTLLSTQTTLALDYFQLRIADEQRLILEKTVADYRASLALVQALVASGLDSEADVETAQSALASARASATDAGIARAQYEHAIAVLIGVAPADFTLPYRKFDQRLPPTPMGLPSDLLERRPDIAAAERQVAQSNAQIGVARAAYFPSLTLSASGGYESTMGSLFRMPNVVWSAGSSMAATLFDAGARRAVVAQARAQNDSATATYRQTVLSAFGAVEDNLASLRILSSELGQAHEATLAAKRAVELTLVLFRNGLNSYLQLVTAQNTFLTARQTELGVQLKQLSASVNLIDNLGGGWAGPLGDTRRTSVAATGHEPPVAARAAAPPNPPPLPEGELQPDFLMQQDEDSMGPTP